MTIADLVEIMRNTPSQVFADLLLGLPLVAFALLVLQSALMIRRRRLRLKRLQWLR